MAQFCDSSLYSSSSKFSSSTKAYFSSGQFLDILLIVFDQENQKNLKNQKNQSDLAIDPYVSCKSKRYS